MGFLTARWSPGTWTGDRTARERGKIHRPGESLSASEVTQPQSDHSCWWTQAPGQIQGKKTQMSGKKCPTISKSLHFSFVGHRLGCFFLSFFFRITVICFNSLQLLPLGILKLFHISPVGDYFSSKSFKRHSGWLNVPLVSGITRRSRLIWYMPCPTGRTQRDSIPQFSCTIIPFMLILFFFPSHLHG